eukprot:750709-Hanusia_phi.AAC.1
MVSDSMLREGEAGFSLENKQMKGSKPSNPRVENNDEFPSEKDFMDSSCPVLNDNLVIEELTYRFQAAITTDTTHLHKSIDSRGNLIPTGSYSSFLLSNQHVLNKSITRYGNFRLTPTGTRQAASRPPEQNKANSSVRGRAAGQSVNLAALHKPVVDHGDFKSLCSSVVAETVRVI